MAKCIEGGVLDPDIDLDEVRAEGERERVRLLMEETASAARQEAIAQALSALEHEIEKVVRVELARSSRKENCRPERYRSTGTTWPRFAHGAPRYPTPLPHSPAAPQTVAAFLGHLATIGGNAKRAAKAISRAHTICRNAIPIQLTDYLVKAILKYLKDVPRRKSPPIN